ncbi:hypothetical protein ACFYYB_37425 [Streptomyces sp. NPDC002886]|uniref:hypothetical protein n=1 Tax=Streptomyces sp. NPDC002886 TaxID=3364667 RepID=UPI0036829785
MFAATCVLLSALGHILMSGSSVPWWGMTAAFAGTSATGWLLAGRERGLAAVVSATLGVQAALHGGFSLAQAAVTRTPEPGSSLGSLGRRWGRYLLCDVPAALRQRADVHGMAGAQGAHGAPVTHGAHGVHGSHGAHGMAGMSGMADGSSFGAAAVPVPDAHAMGAMSPAGMLAGHLLAAVICGLWLAYGERGAFRVLRAVAARFLVPLRLLFRLPAPPHRPRVRPARNHRVRMPRGLLLADALTSRGPPHGIAVV